MNQSIPNILLAVDGSERAQATVNYVAHTLRPQAARLTLFSVLETVPASFWDLERNSDLAPRLKGVKAWAAQRSQEMDAFMHKAQRLLHKAGHPAELISVKVAERHAGVASDILAEAQGPYHTVIFGRRGLGAFRGLVLGSVAIKLINSLSERPVWVVGKGAKPPRLLLALDGSPNSLRAVEYTAGLCAGQPLYLTLLHVVRDARQQAVLRRGETLTAVEKMLERSRQRLLQAGFGPRQVRVQTLHHAASRGGAIVELARKGGYGTIVMGRKGVTEAKEFPLGRVSQKVLQMARGLAVWLIP
ncbi:MAG: universal stress protein [Thermodesulfobacteriota bacterium]